MPVKKEDNFGNLRANTGALTDLGTLGGRNTQGRDINDAGQVVGWSQTADGQQHAFLWENGAMADLENFGADYAVGNDLNNQGEIVGWMSTASGGMRAFLARPTVASGR